MIIFDGIQFFTSNTAISIYIVIIAILIVIIADLILANSFMYTAFWLKVILAFVAVGSLLFFYRHFKLNELV